VSLSFRCRSCGSTKGTLVIDLGIQPLANNLLQPSDLSKSEPRFPLRVAVCESCWLLQIIDIVPPVELFSEYLYFSSVSQALLRHAREASERYIRDFSLGPEHFVVEIASNDGYLLRNFTAAGVPCLGIEPAANIARVAQANGIDTLNRFFGMDTSRDVAASRGRAHLLLGNNVLAHAPDTNDFVGGLAHLLDPDGRIVLEFPYAGDLIEHTEFDTIYHEHVFYFTLTSLLPLFERHGLSIFDVERIPIHGGSLRLFACHAGRYTRSARVDALQEDEDAKGMSGVKYYLGFAEDVASLKRDLCRTLGELKSAGNSIAAYGASAKGSTLLNFYGIGAETLDFVVDKSEYKQGRLTPGAHLPIEAPNVLLERQPDYTLLLTWNFANEILSEQAEYRRRGGRFVIPVPSVRISA
jgi:hypothetical protein